MRTDELSGAALDLAVSVIVENGRPFPIWLDGKPQSYAAYSTDWSQGGQIIEREKIEIFIEDERWKAYSSFSLPRNFDGDTPLIAAMRCYVASKLGDEVDVPEELSKEQA